MRQFQLFLFVLVLVGLGLVGGGLLLCTDLPVEGFACVFFGGLLVISAGMTLANFQGPRPIRVRGRREG